MGTDSSKGLIKTIKVKTKAAKLRPLMPEILQKIDEGVSHEQIVEALNEDDGFDLTLNTFRTYLYRYRKLRPETQSKIIAEIDNEVATNGNLSSLNESDNSDKPSVDNNVNQSDKLSSILNARNRGSIGDDYINKRKPLISKKENKYMKVAIINFSGNVGKSTVAKHLFLPRIKDAEFIAVESINSDEGDAETVRGKHFGQLQEQLLVLDAAVIDVGASNVEEFIKLMQQYRGSHEDFDLFVVPAVKDGKQTKDTIATIEALSAMGVPAKKIRIVFNRVEADEDVEDIFYPLIAYHEDRKSFTLRINAAIKYSELYQRMRSFQTDITSLMQHDQPYYKAKLKEALAANNPAAVETAKAFISMRRLAEDAQENLNGVYSVLIK